MTIPAGPCETHNCTALCPEGALYCPRCTVERAEADAEEAAAKVDACRARIERLLNLLGDERDALRKLEADVSAARAAHAAMVEALTARVAA